MKLDALEARALYAACLFMLSRRPSWAAWMFPLLEKLAPRLADIEMVCWRSSAQPQDGEET